MGDFDKAKEFAEREAQQHPQDVEKGEQAAERVVEKDLGLQGQSQSQAQGQGQDQGNTGGRDDSAAQGDNP